VDVEGVDHAAHLAAFQRAGTSTQGDRSTV